MPDTKLTGLTAITLATGDDLVYLVDDVSGTPTSKKITKANFMKFVDGAVIYDENGNEILSALKTASAVNELTITNAATGNGPTLSATGGDSNIDLNIAGKGTGVPKVSSMKIVTILDTNGNELFKFTTTASAVNELTVANSATSTAVEISTSGGDTNIDCKFAPKGSGTFYGNRETFSYPLTDETTLPTTGVKYVTEPFPYAFTLEDVIIGLTTAGTGATLFSVDVLLEDTAPNTNTFTTIFSTKPTIDASEFTSTTAATPMVLSATAIAKGKRLQLKIHALDSNSLARGVKVSLIGHATAR